MRFEICNTTVTNENAAKFVLALAFLHRLEEYSIHKQKAPLLGGEKYLLLPLFGSGQSRVTNVDTAVKSHVDRRANALCLQLLSGTTNGTSKAQVCRVCAGSSLFDSGHWAVSHSGPTGHSTHLA